MLPSDSARVLTARLETTLTDPALTPKRALEAMLSFYRECRAEGCDLEEDGDMLLFQWGVTRSGDPAFELDLTRQFIVSSGEDHDITQLHLTFRFAVDESTASLDAGDEWCTSPSELDAFTKLIRGHAAFRTVSLRTDGMLALTYDQV